MIWEIFCVFSSSVFLIYVFYCQFCRGINKLNKIPGPDAWPFIGNALDLIASNEVILQKKKMWQNQYGDIFRAWAIHMRIVVIIHPEYAKKILSSSMFNLKPAIYGFLRPWLGDSLFVTNGDKWHHRRKMLTPAFHFDILKQFMGTFVDQSNLLVDRLQQEVGKERTDPVQIVTPTVLNTLCETTMGTDIRTLKREKVTEYFKSIHAFGACLIYRTIRVYLHSSLIYYFTFNRLQRDKAAKMLQSFSESVIQERRVFRQNFGVPNASDTGVYGKKRMAMLDLLLENETEGQIDEVGVREEVDTFMFAGHDTISTSLSFFLLCIANEERVQSSIYEELQSIFGSDDRDPTVQDLNEMKYLECCIKESLRLYPSVPHIMRQVKQDVQLGPYTIPAGTMCLIDIIEMHRQPEFFPEPERFIPERFRAENMNGLQYAYIPFSAGPRNCIGQKYAMMEMKTFLSGILRKFKFEAVTKHEELQFTANILLRPNKPFYVRVINRK